MIPPFPLYVDEITPDKIKATVSNTDSVLHNIRTMSLDTPVHTGLFVEGRINGISILPIGKFICMLIRNNGSTGMIILDLIGKEELAGKMSEKLSHIDLRSRFLQVYEEVVSHPEKHRRFRLVVGRAGDVDVP